MLSRDGPHCTVFIDMYTLLILHNMPIKQLDRVLAATAMKVQRYYREKP
jgi:hypothetical protein